MSALMSSPVPWIVAAVVLFWAVGAYNRLVRLRGEANAAFAALDAQCRRQLDLVQSSLPESLGAPDSVVPGDMVDEVAALWSDLRSAALQFSAALGAMRPRPLDAGAATALATAHEVLTGAWQRVQQDAHDLAGAPVPEALALHWQQMALQVADARAQFNAAVLRYNEAIAQFPALLLARLYGFKPARAL